MDDRVCPLFNAPCLEHKCRWYIHLLGKNPQDGNPIDKFDCAIAFLPILLIENAQQGRQAGAAVESMRNEIVKRMDAPMQIRKPNGPYLPTPS